MVQVTDAVDEECVIDDLWCRWVGSSLVGFIFVFVQAEDGIFFFSSRRRHTISSTVSWARGCV